MHALVQNGFYFVRQNASKDFTSKPFSNEKVKKGINDNLPDILRNSLNSGPFLPVSSGTKAVMFSFSELII